VPRAIAKIEYNARQERNNHSTVSPKSRYPEERNTNPQAKKEIHALQNPKTPSNTGTKLPPWRTHNIQRHSSTGLDRVPKTPCQHRVENI
jgi:hypothetical protein